MINYHIITLFPEIFDWFVSGSIIGKAIARWDISVNFVNPRNWTTDKHHTVDDEIYGGWQWLLIKAEPMILAVNDTIKNIWNSDFKIIYMAPSQITRNQQKAREYSKHKDIIIVCGRYEGIDHRFELYMQDNYNDHYTKISIGQYVLMWWEIASMIIVESTARLSDGVILAWAPQVESYDPNMNLSNIEFPQYTRPIDILWYTVPDVMISWNHAEINKRRESQYTIL